MSPLEPGTLSAPAFGSSCCLSSPWSGLFQMSCECNHARVWLPSLSQTQRRCIHGIQASIARSFASLNCILFYRLQVFVHPRVSLLLPGLSRREGSRERSCRVYEDKGFHISWVNIYEHFGVYGEARFSFVRSCQNAFQHCCMTLHPCSCCCMSPPALGAVSLSDRHVLVCASVCWWGWEGSGCCHLVLCHSIHTLYECTSVCVCAPSLLKHLFRSCAHFVPHPG